MAKNKEEQVVEEPVVVQEEAKNPGIFVRTGLKIRKTLTDAINKIKENK